MQYLLLISLLPVIILLFLVYKLDKKKEPKKTLLTSLLWGALISIPIIIVELIVELFIPDKSILHIFNVFIGVALIEEGFKWLVVKYKYKKDEFDETYDGVVYAVFVSLGFALVENILYVCTKGIGTGVLRALTAVPGHAYYGVIMGYYFGQAKMAKTKKDSSKEKNQLLLSLFIPVLFHGIYDVLLVENLLCILIWFIFVIFVNIYSIRLLFKASKNNTKYIKGKYCIMCGNNVEDMNYCDQCGYKNE